MAVRIFAVQTLLCLVSYTLAQQSFFQPIVILLGPTGAGKTGNADPTCLVRNPPVFRRDDYTYFPGIGGYKLHSEKVGWNEARITCEKEGGHLAIINSVAERDAILEVIKAKTPYPKHVSLGFHDLYQQGRFVTIHGQTLAQAGFNEWAKGEPNGSGRYGALYTSGGLDDCENPPLRPYVCELPIH
ncbi:hemolymph lipopolysaccharide-binding protein-like [Diprion similis]|uniref:hemolymph lipopolysaccharide-binding protein-like n=1 Tax=Diprion similis TaxID=362088 RepID=UPI001EF88BC9|nr:hemolymph lipopolysaccharide-binding protein-like [Diprion similis]